MVEFHLIFTRIIKCEVNVGFEDILEEMEDVLENSWKVPMSGGRSVIDASEIEKLIRDLRLSVPREIVEANRIVETKHEMIQDAKRRCEEIYKIAKKKVAEMAEEHEIVKIAKEREACILRECKKKAVEISSQTRNDILSLLENCESNVSLNLDKMRNLRKNLKVVKISSDV